MALLSIGPVSMEGPCCLEVQYGRALLFRGAVWKGPELASSPFYCGPDGPASVTAQCAVQSLMFTV